MLSKRLNYSPNGIPIGYVPMFIQSPLLPSKPSGDLFRLPNLHTQIPLKPSAAMEATEGERRDERVTN